MLRVLVNAAFATDERVGITLWLERILPELAKHWALTVVTSAPSAFADCSSEVITLPAGIHEHARRLRWTMSRLPRLTRGYDILLCPSPEVPPFAHCTRLAVVHDLIPIKVPRVFSVAYKSFFFTCLQTLRFADGVVTISANTASDLNTLAILPRNRVKIALNGLGTTPVHTDRRDVARSDNDVLYVGGHSPHKNIHRLLAAVAIVRRTLPIRLIIVGWGNDWQVAQTLRDIRRYGLDGSVEVTGRLSDAELSRLYSKCRAFVLPSLYEGFGQPLLEAMSHGTPAACSRVSSLPEVGGDAVLYFNPYDASDIAKQVARLLSEPTTYALLAARAVERSATFSWPRTAAEIVEFSESLRVRRAK
jgi:glycosyltransferase involved in cell wall biosynthesis